MQNTTISFKCHKRGTYSKVAQARFGEYPWAWNSWPADKAELKTVFLDVTLNVIVNKIQLGF